jgi:hypothetical protein
MHFGPNYRPLEFRVVGNNVWQLVLHIPTNSKRIYLAMIAKERDGGWGDKGLTEDSGPTQVNCPLSLLNKADLPGVTGYAVEWRESVRAYHAVKKSVTKPEVGMVLEYQGNRYTMIQKLEPRRGWMVMDSVGKFLRMNARQVASASVVVDVAAEAANKG